MDECYCCSSGFVFVCVVLYFDSDIVTKFGNILPFFKIPLFVLAFKMCSVLIDHVLVNLALA